MPFYNNKVRRVDPSLSMSSIRQISTHALAMVLLEPQLLRNIQIGQLELSDAFARAGEVHLERFAAGVGIVKLRAQRVALLRYVLDCSLGAVSACNGSGMLCR